MINSAQSLSKTKKVPVPKNAPPILLRVIVTLILMGLVFGLSIAISIYSKELNAPPPTNFRECSVAKGSVIQESYPEVCVSKAGQSFMREISEKEKKLLEVPLEESPEGKFCGGIAGLACPEGYLCQLDGSYPDAGGQCVKN